MADATRTVAAIATLATTVTAVSVAASAVASVAVTVVAVTAAATTGLLAAPQLREAATALSPLAAHLRLPATTMTAAATTRGRRVVLQPPVTYKTGVP